MGFVDDLHKKPQDAFGGAVICAVFALRWIVGVAGDYQDGRGVRFFPALAAALFLTVAAALFLRGFQMRRIESRK